MRSWSDNKWGRYLRTKSKSLKRKNTLQVPPSWGTLKKPKCGKKERERDITKMWIRNVLLGRLMKHTCKHGCMHTNTHTYTYTYLCLYMQTKEVTNGGIVHISYTYFEAYFSIADVVSGYYGKPLSILPFVFSFFFSN